MPGTQIQILRLSRMSAAAPVSPRPRRGYALLLIAAGLMLAACSDTTPGTPAPTPGPTEQRSTLPSPIPPAQVEQVAQGASAPRNASEPFAACRHFFAGGQSPTVPPQPQLRPLCFDAFAILHSGQHKTPVFVAQKLNRAQLDHGAPPRHDRFYAEARLPRAERAELDDYRRSGYSRGHMAPAGDMSDPAAMAQSFSLANMVPQAIGHNGGAWAKVEQDTRAFARRARGDVYVITGPVHHDGAPSIGANRVRVPQYLFKLVYDEAGQRAWAHWHANHDDTRGGTPISYPELVQRTGIEFLPGTGLRSAPPG